MADADRRTVKANCGDQVLARRAVGADQRFLEVGAIAGQPTGNSNPFADCSDNAGNEFAAVDVKAIG